MQLAIVAAPSIFAVPTCINKTFKPPFTVRVTIISGVKTQIKATVAAYTLQREQVCLLIWPLSLPLAHGNYQCEPLKCFHSILHS